jgi:DNA-binding response OmpR family regulator
MTSATAIRNDPRALIMIVDDISENREILERYLGNSGFATISCSDGREAVSAISTHCPTIVLLDWMMPELDGLQTLAAIREMHDSVRLPVIMCTAVSADVSVISAINAGANDYITKPINLPILRARINHLLKQTEMTNAIARDKRQAEDRLNDQARTFFRHGRSSDAAIDGRAPRG